MASEALRVLSAAEGGWPIKDKSGKAVNVCPEGHFRVGIIGPVSDACQRTQLGARGQAGLPQPRVCVGVVHV